tara:strand:- start:4913 stop:5101 length:189 start_codon:yes stop_codon:yes gene_type:complete
LAQIGKYCPSNTGENCRPVWKKAISGKIIIIIRYLSEYEDWHVSRLSKYRKIMAYMDIERSK